ncbi:FAD-dependent oxidoreductase [Streptomyces sp. MS2A]|nr:FAD-dependent oxidoreductase [Streptomyces sp. MS2A]
MPIRAESLWRERPVEVPTTPLPQAVEVLVAGAGLTGLTCALELARRGHRVHVVEARRIGAGTTGGTTGKLSLLQGGRYGEVHRRAGRSALGAYAAANRVGADWLRHEMREDPGALHGETAVTFATSPEGLRALSREREASRIAGVPLLSGGDTGLPFPVLGVLRLGDQAALDPRELLRILSERAFRAGVGFSMGARVTGADPLPGGVDVTTTGGRTRASRLIVATGFPAVEDGSFTMLLSPSREFVAAYRVRDRDALPRGMHLSVDHPRRSLRTAVDGSGETLLLVGGEPFVPGRVSDTSPRLAALDAWTQERFGVAQRVRWWGAQDYALPTMLPFAGARPGTGERILLATGYAKWGMTNAVAAALAMAARVDGGSPPWSEVFERPRIGLRSAPTLMGAAAATAVNALRGRVLPTRRPAPDSVVRARVVRRGLGPPVAETRTREGRCAVSAVCTHLGGIVTWNDVERSWDCPLHGSRFAPDGTVLEGPAVRDLPRVDEERP